MKTRLCPFLCLALWSVAVIPELHAAGGPGYALSFDGIDDRVQVGTGMFPTVTNSFTIELWANPTGLRTLTAEANAGVSVLTQRFAVFPEYGYTSYGVDHAGAGLSIGSNGISVFEHALGHLPSVLVYPNALSGWTHVALVYVNRTPQLYVNGTLVRTGLTSTIPFIHPSASLGTWAIDYGTYQGELDEVRIWNAPLSQAQIQANMNRSLAGDEPNLVVYYRCDEGAGLVVADHAPAAPSAPISNGTLTVINGLTNGPTWVLSGIQPFTPFAETLPATATRDFTNRLNGLVNPVGADTRVWFEWGTNMNYGNLTPARAIGSGTSNTNWSEVLGGLENDITYHFRAVASNAFGIALGANLSFTTPPVFTDINAGLPGVSESSVAWGDYDDDGDLDFLLTGFGTNGPIARVYRNNGNETFTDIDAGLPGVLQSSVAWGDFDSDGDLDILLTGQGTNSVIARVYRNDGNATFTDINAVLRRVDVGSAAWGDFDNDGNLDILLTGYADVGGPEAAGPIARVYRNNGDATFTDFDAKLPDVWRSSVAWGDMDNDGDLDILLTGQTDASSLGLIGRVYRNNGNGTFTTLNSFFGEGDVRHSSVAWGDFDNDGALDVLLTGQPHNILGNNPIARVYRNNGAGLSFTRIAGLRGVAHSSVAWGDFDNDGDLDILLTGATYYDPFDSSLHDAPISLVYRNNGNGTFTDIDAGLPGVSESSVAWGDYDNDGDLDILLTGLGTNSVIARVYRNNGTFSNTPPNTPTGLTLAVNQGTATLSWNAATDAQTPGPALTYNVRVGTTPGGSDVVGPMASAGGVRRLPQMGNAQLGLTALLRYNDSTPYYWSVQAVDGAFAGSAFAPEASFRIHTLMTPPTTTNILTGDLNGDGFVDQNELNTVLSNYFPNSPFLQMTNVAGLGGTNVTFALTNSPAGAFSVEYTTNLLDWFFLGPATPRYEFTDTNAPAHPQRYYRLRWP